MPITYGDGSNGTYKPINTVLRQKPSNPNKGDYFDMSNLPQHPQTINRIRPPSAEQAAIDYNYRLGHAQDFVRNRDISSLMQIQKQGGVYQQAATQELERVGFIPKTSPSSPASSANPRPISPPQNNTPTPSTVQPTSKTNSPQISIGNRVGNLANRASNLGERVGNNAGRAAGALAVGTQLISLSKKPSLATGASALGGVLLLVPNPYAQGAGLILSVLGTIGQMFESPENISPNPDIIAQPFEGGQQTGVDYCLLFGCIYTENTTDYELQFTFNRPFRFVAFGQSYTPTEVRSTQSFVGSISASDLTSARVGGETVIKFRGFFVASFGAPLKNIRILSVIRADGQLDTGDDPLAGTEDLPAQVINSNYDGWITPRWDNLKDNLTSLKDGIDQRNLSDTQKDSLKDSLKGFFPQSNNGITPRVENRTIQPLPDPLLSQSLSDLVKQNNSDSTIRNPNFNGVIQNFVDENGLPLQSANSETEKGLHEQALEEFQRKYNQGSAFPNGKAPTYEESLKQFQQKYNQNSVFKGKGILPGDKTTTSTGTTVKLGSKYAFNQAPSTKKLVPVPSAVPRTTPNPNPLSTTPQSSTNNDRFKQSDCNFSCENLAKCFTDVVVQVFDGCNPDTGEAEIKEITIQTLPKDKNKTIASFAELLAMRSKECELDDKVRTTPEYWPTRVGQIPQAIVLFETVTRNEHGNKSYYQLQIPHYTGGKNTKPSLPSYQKGECMAIYTCLDNSAMQVYASTDAEALRMINAMEKYINPRMRMRDKKNIKTGKRGGMEKVQVKPIRLDFSSTGQARNSPDWSIKL